VAHVLGRLDVAAFEQRFLPDRAAGETFDASQSACAALARTGTARAHADALADATSTSTRSATRAALEAIRARGVPVLIVHGSGEPLVHDVHGAEVVMLDGAGHSPHLTRTEEVAAAIRRFLRAVDAAHPPSAREAARAGATG
jgi:pimeloyl-ACP methyl ester carboxylesterase